VAVPEELAEDEELELAIIWDKDCNRDSIKPPLPEGVTEDAEFADGKLLLMPFEVPLIELN
jgi:hypothetical protein